LAVLGMLAASCGDDDDASSDDQASVDDGGASSDDGGASTDDGGAADDDGGTSDGGATTDQCNPNAILTWGYGDQIRDWDPHDSPAGQDQWYLMTVYDRLFHQSPDGQTIPGLAESWSYSDDALTLTVNLREGVLFHDGTALTADIVVQNLERSRGATDTAEGVEPAFASSFKADLAAVTEVVAVDDLTVNIVTSTPNVTIPAVLSDRPGMIMHPDTFDGSGNTDPIGTGPFVLDSWTEGDGGEAVLSGSCSRTSGPRALGTRPSPVATSTARASIPPTSPPPRPIPTSPSRPATPSSSTGT
jgi:ABC-type transport system substrate-binding protein